MREAPGRRKKKRQLAQKKKGQARRRKGRGRGRDHGGKGNLQRPFALQRMLLLLLELQAQKLGVISAAAGYMGVNCRASGCSLSLSGSGRMMEAVPASEIGKEARS